MPYIDLAFRLTGATVPVDHGYALYAALSRIIPELHEAQEIGVHPVRGVYGGDGKLHLADFSQLILRLPEDQIRTYLNLAGKRLDVNGYILRVGVSDILALRSHTTLYSRLVTIKGFTEQEAFLAAANRQLKEIGGTAELRLRERRTFRVKDKQVVGFEMVVSQLASQDSLKLQEVGLGGRRRFGCGVFVPYGGER